MMQAAASDFLGRLGEIARIVHEGKDSQDVLSRMAYAICFDSPWKSSSIMAVDAPAGKCIEVAHFSRSQTDRVRPTAWNLSTSPTSVVLASGEPVVIEDALTQTAYPEYWADAQVQRYRTVVLLPLRATDRDGRPLVMSLQSHDRLEISPIMLTYLSTCADLAGMAVEKGKTLESRDDAIEKLSSVLMLQRSLVSQALKETSFQTLVQLCHRHLASPFIVGDLVLGRAYCSGFADNRAMDELCNGSGWRAIEGFFKVTGGETFDKKTVLKLGAGAVTLDVLSQAIMADGEIIGGIALVVNRETSQEIIEAAEAIWMVLSIALLRNHIHFQANKQSSSEFLSELFEGKLGAFPLQDHPYAHIFKQSHNLVALRSDATAVSLSAVMWSISRLVQTMAQRIVTGIVGQFVVLLVPQNEFDARTMQRFTDQVLAEAERLSAGRCVMLEIPDCAVPADYASAWRRALRLSDWAVSNKRYGRLSLTDTGPFGILSEMLDYTLVSTYCRTVLDGIRQHDATQSAPLLPTLQALVRHGGRPQPVADELNVHISTVRYRIDKIREAFGIDVRDAETRFRVEMALRLTMLLPEIEDQAADTCAPGFRPGARRRDPESVSSRSVIASASDNAAKTKS